MRALILVLAISAATACTAGRDQLGRAETAFEANNLERAELSLRDLEPNVRGLDASDRARYAYLRGMTELRLGDRATARHWLGIAKANDGAALAADRQARLDEALKDLDTAVYDDGYASLLTSKK